MRDFKLSTDQARPALQRFASVASGGLARLVLLGVNQVGARPRIHGRPFIENLGRIVIGDDLALSSTPTRTHLVTGVHGVIEIGDRVTIARGVGIAAEARIVVGSGVHLAPFVMILDTDYHAVEDRGAPGVAEPIIIGEGAWLGEGVTVLRGAHIGKGAHVEAGSVVSGTIPDGARASGVPARVLVPAPDKPTPVALAEPDLQARVQRVAREVFALSRTPATTDGPPQIHAWDSLGALRLLVSIEEELGVSLPQDALTGVHDLAGLCDVAARSLPRRAALRAH